MAITTNAADNEKYKFKEAASLLGQPGVVVLNPDGSNVGAGTSTTPGVVGLEYNATPPTLSDGGTDAIQGDVNANTKVTLATAVSGENLPQDVLGTIFKPTINSAYTPNIHQDAGTVTKANIKAVAGSVFSIRVSNRNASTRYFLLHNKATAPIATDTPQSFYELAPGAILQLGIDDFAPAEYFSTGIGWSISTTAASFTDAATASEHTVMVKHL